MTHLLVGCLNSQALPSGGWFRGRTQGESRGGG